MSAVILAIGNVDLSDYAEQGAIEIVTTPVYSESGFTALSGKQQKKYLGDRIDINADLGRLPEDIVSAIVTECGKSENVSISYRDPSEKTAKFDRPTISRNMDYLDTNGIQYWNVNISMCCPVDQGNSL